MSAKTLEVSLLGVGTVLRLDRDAWSMVKRLRQTTNETPPAPPPKKSQKGVTNALAVWQCLFQKSSDTDTFSSEKHMQTFGYR